MKKFCILCLVLVLAASMLTACRGGNVGTTEPATTMPPVTTAPTRPTTMPTQATTAPTAPITTPSTSPSTVTDVTDGTDMVPDGTGEMGRIRTRRAS